MSALMNLADGSTGSGWLLSEREGGAVNLFAFEHAVPACRYIADVVSRDRTSSMVGGCRGGVYIGTRAVIGTDAGSSRRARWITATRAVACAAGEVHVGRVAAADERARSGQSARRRTVYTTRARRHAVTSWCAFTCPS